MAKSTRAGTDPTWYEDSNLAAQLAQATPVVAALVGDSSSGSVVVLAVAAAGGAVLAAGLRRLAGWRPVSVCTCCVQSPRTAVRPATSGTLDESVN